MNLNFYGEDNRERSRLDLFYEAVFHVEELDCSRNFLDIPLTTNVIADVIADSDPRTHRESRLASRTRICAAASQRHEFSIFCLGMKSKYGGAPRRPKNNKDDTMS